MNSENNPFITLFKEYLKKKDTEKIIVLYVYNKSYYTLTIDKNLLIVNKKYFWDTDVKMYYNSTMYDEPHKYKGDNILDKHHSKYPSNTLYSSYHFKLHIDDIYHILRYGRIITIEISTSPRFYKVVYKCLELTYNYYQLKKIIRIQRLYKEKFYKFGGKGYFYRKKHFEISL